MRKVGTVKEIWRYPVKGMAGEAVDACGLTASGLNGDRLWAVRDARRNEIQSCKFRPQLLHCSARWPDLVAVDFGAAVEVVFPGGAVLNSSDPQIHAQLSELVGHPSRLEALVPGSALEGFRRFKQDDHTWLEELKATFAREDGEPLPDFSQLPQSVIDYVCAPGSFFLVAPLHLITTATLKHLSRLDPQLDWDRRRFRPNLVVETEAGAEGVLEQEWVGKQLRIGNVLIDCTGTTPRCGAITRAQHDLAAESSVLRTVVREADQNAGVYGRPVSLGDLKVGDEVWLA